MVDQPPLSREDYEAIEAAVMETSRGRWFLAEYARHNRTADTKVLLDALQRIEDTFRRQSISEDVSRLRRDLDDMATGIARTKRDLATSLADATGQGQRPSAERAFDDVVKAAEKADSDVFAAAEHVQEIAWSLRETGDAQHATEDLDRQALELYRASNQHALTTNRVRAIVGVLRFMESRISQMIGTWSSDTDFVDTPSAPGHAADGRRMLIETAPPRIRDDIVFVEAPGRPRDREVTPPARQADAQPSAPAVASVQPPRMPDLPPAMGRAAHVSTDPRSHAFASIDVLSSEQKLLLFA